jgi:hypothetical protein
MTKIASLTPKVPRGTIISEQTGGPPLSEAEHFWKCELCSGYFDMRDLGAMLEHEEPVPHPVEEALGTASWREIDDRQSAQPFGGKGTMDGYRSEPCGASRCWHTKVRCRTMRPGSIAMSDQQSLPPRAAQRPRCPRCQARVTVQRTVASRPGFEHWTLRCTKCGHIHEAQVEVDPK